MHLLLALALLAVPAPRVHNAISPVDRDLLSLRVAVLPNLAVSNWSLQSTNDPNFATPQRPTATTSKTWAGALIPAPGGWPLTPVPAHEVLLKFSTPLLSGATYTLTESGGGSWAFPFDPEMDFSPSLKVNQIGFFPNSPRYAYLSYWTRGVSPVSPVGSNLGFHVVNDQGSTVLSGQFTLRLSSTATTDDAYDTNYTRADVFEADLSGVQGEGSYYLVWDGVGRSASFDIGPNVYAQAFSVAFKGLYHQRCGIALEAPYTRFTHGQCHTAAVSVTTVNPFTSRWDNFTDLPANTTGATLNVVGGYHDAGDYDRRYQHLRITNLLVDLYEMAPAVFARDDLDLPESGNGIPDILDEARWAVDFMVQLQEADGSVHAGVEESDYPAWEDMPDNDPLQWFAYAAEPIATYSFAASAAKLSRAMQPFDATAAAVYLQRAQQAWNWGEDHPGNYTGSVQDQLGVAVGYAAAELYKTSGQPGFQTAFLERGPFAGGNTGFALARWDPDDLVDQLYTYATTAGADPVYRAAAVRVITERAADRVATAAGTGYRNPKSPYAPVGFGSLTTPNEAVTLFRAHHLTGNRTFLDWGVAQCDLALGANAMGLVWITGLGWRGVQHPLSTQSIADGLEDPVPGLPLYGPTRSESTSGLFGFAAGAYEPPISEWPLAERYVDVTYAPIMNEYTVQESVGPTAFVFGYLAFTQGSGLPPGSTGSSSGGSSSSTAGSSGSSSTGSSSGSSSSGSSGGSSGSRFDGGAAGAADTADQDATPAGCPNCTGGSFPSLWAVLACTLIAMRRGGRNSPQA